MISGAHLLQRLHEAWREGDQRLGAPLGHEGGRRLFLGPPRQPEIHRIPKHQRWPPLQTCGTSSLTDAYMTHVCR